MSWERDRPTLDKLVRFFVVWCGVLGEEFPLLFAFEVAGVPLLSHRG